MPVQRGDATPGRESVQRTSPSGSSAASSFARRDDEAPERRPARLPVLAEQSLRAVLLNDPDARVGRDEKLPRRRKREERRLRALDADDLADLVENGAARRAQCSGEKRGERDGDRRHARPV